MTTPPIAHPPETLEGWFALHQIFRFRKSKIDSGRLDKLVKSALATLGSGGASRSKPRTRKSDSSAGWSCFVKLIGSTADVMVIHFRDSLDALGEAQAELARTELARNLEPVYAFLSVTEVGLYHISAELARAALARGGKV